MVVYQKIRTNSKGAPCVLGESIPPNTEAWWDTEKQGFVCRMHYEATIAPPEPKAEPSSQASAPQGAHTIEGGGSAAAETPNPGTGQGPGGAPEASRSKAPEPVTAPNPLESVVETMRLMQGGKANSVWICLRTDYGRVEVAAMVEQLPGEALQAQITRVRNAVRTEFEQEKRR